ncbi:MAG: hypothetical protein Pg6A_19540 [Termitinemataceae bacterium]|nr:MAG: hypothetical protein Pg6A_19540 [Termitinemataceae bacterium]
MAVTLDTKDREFLEELHSFVKSRDNGRGGDVTIMDAWCIYAQEYRRIGRAFMNIMSHINSHPSTGLYLAFMGSAGLLFNEAVKDNNADDFKELRRTNQSVFILSSAVDDEDDVSIYRIHDFDLVREQYAMLYRG